MTWDPSPVGSVSVYTEPFFSLHRSGKFTFGPQATHTRSLLHKATRILHNKSRYPCDKAVNKIDTREVSLHCSEYIEDRSPEKIKRRHPKIPKVA